MGTFILPGGAVSVAGTADDDIFIATSATLAAGLSLDGGGGNDTLYLTGGGTFDLGALASLAGVERMDVVAGGGSIAHVTPRPTVILRDGTSLQVRVVLAEDAGPQDGADIVGAANSDTIQLGPHADSVTLGSEEETVMGGAGRTYIFSEPAYLGATMTAGASGGSLTVTGPGAGVMGPAVTGFDSVAIQADGPGGYDFTAGPEPGLIVRAPPATAAGVHVTLRAGGPDQTLDGSVSRESEGTVRLVAAPGGATLFQSVLGRRGQSRIDGFERPGNAIELFGVVAPANVRLEYEGGVLAVQPAPLLSLQSEALVRLADAEDLDRFDPDGFHAVQSGPRSTHIVYDAPSGGVFALSGGTDAIAGTAGDDVIVVQAAAIGTGDAVNTGGGTDTLRLVGAGTFDLRKLASVTGVERLVAQEGGSGHAQNVWLRDGTALDVEVKGSFDNYGAGFLNSITIHGARNADTIRLGAGVSVVHLGDVRETVIGGSGSVAIFADARLLSATLSGGGGGGTLYVTGGGTGVMGSGITRMQTVVLVAGGPACDFTANGLSGLTIRGTSGHDTIRAGGANQVIASGGGADHLVAAAAGHTTFRNGLAAFDGATIDGFGSDGDVIDVTGVAAGDLGLSYDDGVLTLTHGGSIAEIALGGSFSAAGFHTASDGHGGTAITYASPTVAGMAALMDEAARRAPSPLETAAASDLGPAPPAHDKSVLGLAAAG